ncbi:hypothetical protein DINM_000982 [Dirofilaria immitis]|nr:hypothetical protein [Dirofilaria immitis]
MSIFMRKYGKRIRRDATNRLNTCPEYARLVIGNIWIHRTMEKEITLSPKRSLDNIGILVSLKLTMTSFTSLVALSLNILPCDAFYIFSIVCLNRSIRWIVLNLTTLGQVSKQNRMQRIIFDSNVLLKEPHKIDVYGMIRRTM